MAEKSSALATVPGGKVSTGDLEMAYRAILDGEPIAASADPELVSRAIVERILASETFEEAFSPQELEGWKAHMDEPVLVRGFHFNPTGYENEGGASVYAVVDVERIAHEGEVATWTCGGRNVLAQLVKMLEKGWLDRPVKLTAKQTAEGYEALWLVAA